MVLQMYFQYGETELSYLMKKDRKLAHVIEQVGMIERKTEPDLFAAVIHHIIGQQISTKAQATVWRRLQELLGQINADTVLASGADQLQSCGISFRKANYLLDFATRVKCGDFVPDKLRQMDDAEAIAALSALKGIGVWTAEMLLLFSLQRPDIFSFGDFGLQRGLRMLYRHREIDRPLFEKYRRRFSPYGSTASLYLWAVAGGALPDLTDPKQQTTTRRASR